MRCGVFDTRKGSAFIEMGATKVVCTIDGPKEPSKSMDTDCSEGVINVQVVGVAGLSHVIESALRAIIALEHLSKMQVDVEVTVLEDDGGVLAAALMCSSLALCNAGIQTLDFCVAAHVIITEDGSLKLDASSSEGDGCASVTVALMPSLKQNVCCEHRGISTLKQFKSALSLAAKSSLYLWPVLKNAITHQSSGASHCVNGQ
uniref:Exosome complex exonuclease MTR3 n=1 Tax=Ascaris suum TaxID=6253 RepID=F1L568_ASCSU